MGAEDRYVERSRRTKRSGGGICVCVGTHRFCVKKELCWKLYLYVNRVWVVEGGMSSALGEQNAVEEVYVPPP